MKPHLPSDSPLPRPEEIRERIRTARLTGDSWPIFEHHKEISAVGWEQLEGVAWVLALLAPALGVLWYLLFGDLGPAPPDSSALLVVGMVVAGLLLAGSVIGIVAMRNIRSSDSFICELDRQQIRCLFPEKDHRDDSFMVNVGEIVRIEQVFLGSGENSPPRWYLCDRAGGRYWLTEAYGNPAEKFIELLRWLNPTIELGERRDYR